MKISEANIDRARKEIAAALLRQPVSTIEMLCAMASVTCSIEHLDHSLTPEFRQAFDAALKVGRADMDLQKTMRRN